MTLNAALAVLLLFSAICYLVFGVRLLAAKREVGAMSFGALFVVVSFWVLGGAIELMSNSFYVFAIGRTGHFIGTAFLPVAAYVCFREYAGQSTSVHRVTLLLIIPIVSVTLAATNSFHEFMVRQSCATTCRHRRMRVEPRYQYCLPPASPYENR